MEPYLYKIGCRSVESNKINWSLSETMRLRFSAYRCFSMDDSASDIACLRQLGEKIEKMPEPLAFLGSSGFGEYFLRHVPSVKNKVHCFLREDPFSTFDDIEGVKVEPYHNKIFEMKSVFITERSAYERYRLINRLPDHVSVAGPDDIKKLRLTTIPKKAFIPFFESIYPISIPDVTVSFELDMLLLDCPARNMSLMPNGLAYVNSLLKKSGIKCETLDLDIILYHKYHIHRLLDDSARIPLPGGELLPDDPWLIENDSVWKKIENLNFILPQINKAVREIVKARPKILGVSVHENNIIASHYIVSRIVEKFPEIVVIAGGYSCLDSEIGINAFPVADYMVIGEAEEVLLPLVNKLKSGKLPSNLPGIISKYDDPDIPFRPGPLPMNLDDITPPQYDWCDINLYRNWNGYSLTPVVASRGCRWARCTFCTERFYWRNRSAVNVVDELERYFKSGKDLFMLNDSDFNGDPVFVEALCQEIIKRPLTIRLTGQLRIDPRNSIELFKLMRLAGFVAIRFGVDAWSENTLKIAKKGYSVKTIASNLEACKEAEIYCEVNLVVGYPGETDGDIEETIDNISLQKETIGRFAVVNPLMLKVGSDFWDYSEKYKIFFIGNKQDIYRTYPNGIPSNLWYSKKPFIDESVRASRVAQILKAISEAGVSIGEVAARRITDMEQGRDEMRGNLNGNESLTNALQQKEDTCFADYIASGSIIEHSGRFFLLPAGMEISGEALFLDCSTGKIPESKVYFCPSHEKTDLISADLMGFSVFQVGLNYIAVKNGELLDFEKIYSDGYEEGVFFSEDNVYRLQKLLVDKKRYERMEIDSDEHGSS